MELAINHITPLIVREDDGKSMPAIVVATVEGDIHDIGKNLVVLMLRNYGFPVIDLGKDVPADVIGQRDHARQYGCAGNLQAARNVLPDGGGNSRRPVAGL